MTAAEMVEAPLAVVQALRDLEVAIRKEHGTAAGEYPFAASCPICEALRRLDAVRKDAT